LLGLLGHCKNRIKENLSMDSKISTLFININSVQQSLLYSYQLDSSLEFLSCADKQLTKLFILSTGLKPNKNLSFSISEHWQNFPLLELGKVSKLNINLYVNHNWNPVVVLWNSKSGRIYKIADTDIDCNDIEFSFEKLDSQLYIAQLYPKGQKLPFVLKNLPYELVVTRLNIDCTILLSIKEGYENVREEIIKGLYAFTQKFNEASEKKSVEEEVVEKYLGKQECTLTIVFEIDMSLAGFEYLKKLLKYLAKIEGVKKVEIA
jgi:hypothetical protein